MYLVFSELIGTKFGKISKRENISNIGLDEAQAGIKIARRNISNLRYADDTTQMAQSEEELKMRVKEESEKLA